MDVQQTSKHNACMCAVNTQQGAATLRDVYAGAFRADPCGETDETKPFCCDAITMGPSSYNDSGATAPAVPSSAVINMDSKS